MRIVTVLGSPRKRGNTSEILEAFERLLNYLQCQPAPIYVLDNCSTRPEGPGADGKALAQRMSRELLA